MDKMILKDYAKKNPRRDVAVVGLRDGEGNVLLARSHKLPDHWQPIGGGIDENDASPADAAVRELKEEFDLEFRADALTQVMTMPYDFGEGTIYFYELKVDRSKLQITVDSEEIAEYRWFSKDEVLALPAMPATAQYLKSIAG